VPPTIRRKIFGVQIDAHPIVFPAGAGLIILFVIITVLAPRRSLMLYNWLQSSISANFSWLYILAMSGFLAFAIWLCLSRYGSIRLGPDNEKPEFNTLTWFSMLFSAGMGIGMLFFGVAEPMAHFNNPLHAEAGSLHAARDSMGITMFHWCLHPWALYSLVALALAYFGFRRGLPLSFRSVFYPLIGERVHGRIGDVIDIMAVLATLFGLATSLGLGAKQVNAGLNYVFGLPQGTGIQIVLIACITAMAVASLVSGLHVGIRRLSELNMCLAGFLLVFLFVMGPTVYLLNSTVQNVGTYLQKLPTHAFWTATYTGGQQASWFGGWTIFYWGWWIAWSPFVGMFIARVSKGRTIREFVMGVLLVPSAVAVLWMSGFGNSALHQEIYDDIVISEAQVQAVEQVYNYQPKQYSVQVLDEEHGLPMTEDEQWLVAPDAQRVATPTGVLVEDDGQGNLVTKDGTPVNYRLGVLVNTKTGWPVRVTEDNHFTGQYKVERKGLTLGGYLSGSSPVLNDTEDSLRDTTSTAMFVMLEAYPITWLTALIGTISVVLFFVTSSDSASLVADIIASGGNQDPPTGTRLFWGILEGTLAAVLLLAGGLIALQTGAITVGLPFCIVIIGMCVSLLHGLRREWLGKIPDEQKRYARFGEEYEESTVTETGESTPHEFDVEDV